MQNWQEYLGNLSYPGRGVFCGLNPAGTEAVIAYFIMGRSINSRNRIFVADAEGLRTQAFDPAKLSDPSLIIYAPVRVLDNTTIITNGDQTDTIYDYLKRGESWQAALNSRTYEPDAPNFTPRISGLLQIADNTCNYSLSILKKAAESDDCLRLFWDCQAQAGQGNLIHTYAADSEPLPPFAAAEPICLPTLDNSAEFGSLLWQNLNAKNKVSLFVRYLNIIDGQTTDQIFNKHCGD
jgi:IMP cyclohydrolase